jgi:hypothetical protein
MSPEQMLAAAQMAYHQLMTGCLAVEVVVDGYTTRFNRANASELQAYISRLQAQINNCPTVGAIGIVF